MVAGLLLAILVGYGGHLATRHSESKSQPQPFVAPPNAAQAAEALLKLTLPDLQGTPQALRQWQGRVLVVNFWATWCAPCRKEIPGFSHLQRQYSDKSVQFIGIAFDSADKVTEFSRQTNIAYPILIAGQELAPITVGLGNAANGLPFTAIIDRDGHLLQSRLGVWQETELGIILDDLTGAAARSPTDRP